MTIKELKEQIKEINDTFEVLIYDGIIYKEVKETSVIFTPKGFNDVPYGSFNIEVLK